MIGLVDARTHDVLRQRDEWQGTHPKGSPLRRTVFNEDHEAFRQTLRSFIEAEVTPHFED